MVGSTCLRRLARQCHAVSCDYLARCLACRAGTGAATRSSPVRLQSEARSGPATHPARARTRRGGHPELARGLRVKLARLLQSIALLEFLERSGSLWTKLSVHRSGIVAIILESLLCLPQFFRTRGWVRGRC